MVSVEEHVRRMWRCGDSTDPLLMRLTFLRCQSDNKVPHTEIVGDIVFRELGQMASSLSCAQEEGLACACTGGWRSSLC